MATPEFEVYLAVLGRTLRLSKDESRELAAELSDHFEERLADLLDAGVERQRAVRMVLDDFGEAAELAARFSGLASVRQRRRWIMRATMGSCLAAAAVAALVFYSPGPQPIAQVVQAQNTPAAAPAGEAAAPSGEADPFTVRSGEEAAAPAVPHKADGAEAVKKAAGFRGTTSTPVDPTAKRIEERLAASLPGLDLHEPSLEEIVDFLSDSAEVDIVLDRGSLENAGIELNATYPMRFSKSQINVNTALRLLVEQMGDGFDFVVRNGVVVIGDSSLLDTTRIYDCRGVIQRVGNVQPIVDAIQRNVSPDSWRRNGSLTGAYMNAASSSPGGEYGSGANVVPAGATSLASMSGMSSGMGGMGGGGGSDDEGKTAAVSAVGGLLIITQSPAAHRQIADLLTQLDAVLAAQ